MRVVEGQRLIVLPKGRLVATAFPAPCRGLPGKVVFNHNAIGSNDVTSFFLFFCELFVERFRIAVIDLHRAVV